ncbi:MAG TPA: DUF3306 domain-containing protein [Burkholderiales bacterium]
MSSREDLPPVSAERSEEEGFLRRWSRRKHEAQAQRAETADPAPPAAEAAPPAPPKILTDADMPPIESLDAHSDFSVFLSAGVSEELRRRALRKLFTLPEINRRCPLDGEWYDGHGYEPLGDIITYDMREEMERAAQKLKETMERSVAGDADAAPPSASAAAGPDAPASTASVQPSLPARARDVSEEHKT